MLSSTDRRLPEARPFLRLLVAASVLAAALGVGLGVALHLTLQSSRARPALALPALHGQAVWPAGRRPAPAFALRDQDGRLVSVASQHGRTVVVAFLDPRCKQPCQLEGRSLALVERQVERAQRPTLLIVSLNPRASGAEAKAAARGWGISGAWHWLLGRPEQLAPVWQAYGITVAASERGIHGTPPVYLIDRRGFERAGFHAPLPVPFVADDLRALAQGTA